MAQKLNYLINKSYELICDQDMFGHSIEISYNKKGSSHATIFGGILSIVAKLFLLSQLVI